MVLNVDPAVRVSGSIFSVVSLLGNAEIKLSAAFFFISVHKSACSGF
jgi:hypothetical protein